MKIVIPMLLCAAATVASAERYGAPITSQGAAPLESAIEKLAAEAAADVLIEGKVAKVCKAKGCWLGLESTSGAVHVTFANDSFFVPPTLVGKIVRAQGAAHEGGRAVRAGRERDRREDVPQAPMSVTVRN